MIGASPLHFPDSYCEDWADPVQQETSRQHFIINIYLPLEDRSLILTLWIDHNVAMHIFDTAQASIFSADFNNGVSAYSMARRAHYLNILRHSSSSSSSSNNNVCIYIYIYTHVYVYIYIYIYTYTHTIYVYAVL